MFSIKAVSNATGVSIETLRAWERRYRVVEPRRDTNGRRSYEAQDVIRLRKLREATECGHPISKLAKLSDEQLTGAIADAAANAPERSASRSYAEQMLSAAEHYKPDDCDQALSMALALLPLRQVVEEVLAPVLVEVGERWHAGNLTIAQERVLTGSVRRQVGNVIETYNRIAKGAPVVFATLPDERHELGILMCALLASARGIRCQYLGPDIPASDIAVFAERIGASAVVLSMVRREAMVEAREHLAELLSLLVPTMPVLIGGLASLELGDRDLGERAKVIQSYQAFEAELDGMPRKGR